MSGGCYLSHGREGSDAAALPDGGTDASGGCLSDAECADGDRCTIDRCVAGRCEYEPIPFSRHTAYRAATGSAVDVTSDGARALVLTASLGVEPFDASGPMGAPSVLAPTGGDRDWDSAIATNGEDALVVSLTETSIVLQSLSGDVRETLPRRGYFVTAAWTGRRFFSIEHDFDATCVVREIDAARGFVGDPVRASCPYTPVPAAFNVPPWTRPVRGANGAGRLLSFGRERELVEWTESGETRRLTLASEHGLARHSFTSREVDGLLGAAWVRIDDGAATVEAAVLEEAGDTLSPVRPPIERPTPEGIGSYSLWMSAAACSHRFVLVSADATGVYVVELDRRGEPLSDWHSLGPFSQVADVSSACVDGGVVIAEWDAVHVLTCEP